MLGHRAYYENGWLASTTPPSPQWVRQPPPPTDAYQWELYHLETYYSKSANLATQHPDKLAELKAGFDSAAARYNVYPLDNRPRLRQRTSSLRPYVTNGRNQFEYYRTETRLQHSAFPDVKNRAWTLIANITVPDVGANGVIATQGGNGNGWGLLVFEGVPTFIYKASNLPGDEWRLMGAAALPPGDHTLHIRMTLDADTPGAGAAVELTVNNKAIGTVHPDRTVPDTFPFFEGVGIGRDFVTSLTEDYEVPFRYPGRIGPVRITIEGSR